MTVSLLIKYTTPNRQAELIPVAVQRSFDRYWMPASTAIGLKWIPLFGALRIEQEYIPEVVDELTQLERFFRNWTDLSPELVNHFESRIERLKSVLQDAQQNWEDIEGLSL